MERRPGEDQPTVFSDAAHRAGAAPTATPAPSETIDAVPGPARPGGIARRTGIVFVHGIGNQAPAETFLDWAGAIVGLLTDWHTSVTAVSLAHDDGAPSAPESAVRIDDPVWRAEFSLSAASPPYLEIAVPAYAGVPATTWVATEAWWAADLRAPDLGRTIDYLRHRIGMVVSGIASGYRDRAARLLDLAQATDVMNSGPPPLDWRLAEALDRIQSRTFGSPPVGWLVGAAGAAMLAGYDVLRRVPLPPLRDFAVRRMVDSFLVDWFGDLPVLLDEPVESANVRARLARSIQRLVDDGCDAIVVVAHSGGALVSFETLLDPAYAHLPVDKLVTLGQGLGLAWRLAADPTAHEIAPGDRLVGNLGRVRPGLRWVDFWASYDPAPAGPLPARGGLIAEDPWLLERPVALPGEPQPTAPAATILVESRPVTNEMNVLTDHGAYWANPEGFLIPLVRHLDAATGDATDSRFYRDKTDRTRRIVWRRERVSALAAWGWACALSTIGTCIGLIALQAVGNARLSDAGRGFAAAWDQIPGHEIVSGPVVAIGTIVGTLLGGVGLDTLARGIGSLGPAMLGLALVIALFAALTRIGLARWHRWDARERRAMHPETVVPPSRSSAFAEAVLLVGGVIAVVAAMFGLGQASGVALALGGAAGLVLWIRGAQQHPGTTRPSAP
jgi:hypothetical protein